ncbi:hypothetical protein [Clostridium cochlearium]|uniref:Uncharacterized protein n=1 Tax=Clostridium cochlearium TaxID=1494 RepID=A0A2X2W6W9_CLOCO|nr:hypothetical protein [Clostridium cochlearium]MBU5268910.1 hypothetical protein [Clostridium cochlearium]SQB33691.1 Uncharacterised protein [Clostridium cochlearium]
MKEYIDYEVIISNLCLPQNNIIKIKSIYENIDKIELKQIEKYGYIYTIFKFISNGKLKEKVKFRINCDEAINDILNKIAFKGFDVSSDPQIKEISFNNTTNTSTSIGCSVKICSSNDVQQKLKEEIETERTYNNYYYEMYRSAIKNKDVVARYMFLYNIILQICNDKQNRVDAFIVDKIGADRSEYKSGPICNKKGEHIKETVFTRLRNEVGHARKGTNADATRVEMNMKVDELSELVRKAIVEKIETNKQN